MQKKKLIPYRWSVTSIRAKVQEHVTRGPTQSMPISVHLTPPSFDELNEPNLQKTISPLNEKGQRKRRWNLIMKYACLTRAAAFFIHS